MITESSWKTSAACRRPHKAKEQNGGGGSRAAGSRAGGTNGGEWSMLNGLFWATRRVIYGELREQLSYNAWR